MRKILTAILFLSSICVGAQTDTTIKTIHYYSVDYYQNHSVKSIGNISDSLKTGHWTYFKPDGNILAKGEYVKGRKMGKWEYIDYQNKKHKHKWNLKEDQRERFAIENGELNIYDILAVPDGVGYTTIFYTNGANNSYILD